MADLNSDANDPLGERREAYYSGHVQGVGFRYAAHHIAGGFRVTGFVRNLPDGRVHLVAEGARDEVASYLKDISTTMAGHIRSVAVDTRPATGEFSSFEIRH